MEGFNALPGVTGNVLSDALIRVGVITDRVGTGAKRAVAELNAELQKAGAGLAQGMAQANQQVEAVDRNVTSLLTGLRYAAIVGGAIAAPVGLAIRAAVGYDTALTQMRKTVRGSEAELASLSDRFLDMSAKTTTSAVGLVNIAAAAGQVGVATRDLLKFVEVVDTLALATDISVGQAVSSLGELRTTLRLDVAEYGNFGSALVGLSNQLSATSSQILSISQRAAAVGSNIGLTPQQILGYSAAIGSVGGLGNESAGNVLNRLFGGMQEFIGKGTEANALALRLGATVGGLNVHAREGTEQFDLWAQSLGMTNAELREMIEGGKTAELMAKTAGLSSGAFRALFSSSPSTAMRQFLTGLGQLDAFTQRKTLDELGFTDAGMQQGILALATNLDVLNKALGTSEAEWNRNAAASEAAAKQLDSLPARIAKLKNELMAIATRAGQDFVPVLKDAVTWLTENIPGALREVARVWDTVLRPAFEPLAKSLMQLGNTITDIFVDWSAWNPLMGETGRQANAVTGGLSGIAGAVAMVVNYMTRMVDLFDSFLSLPGVKQLIQAGLTAGGMYLQLRLMLGLVNSLKGAATLAGRVTGFGGRAVPTTPEGQALMTAATAHEGAAASLTRSASALEAAAAQFKLGQLTGGGKWVPGNLGLPGQGLTMMGAPTLGRFSRPGQAGGFAGAGGWDPVSGRLRDPLTGRFLPFSVPIQGMPNTFATRAAAAAGDMSGITAVGNNPMEKAAYLRMAAESRRAGLSVARRAAEDMANGMREAATLARGGLSRLSGAASSALAMAGRAFWPLLIGDMVANIAAGPISGLVANLTGNQRHAGAQGWQELLGNINAQLKGLAPELIGRQARYQIGEQEVGIGLLAAGGATGLDLDRLEAGGLTGLSQQRSTAAKLKQYALAAEVSLGNILELTETGLEFQNMFREAGLELGQPTEGQSPEEFYRLAKERLANHWTGVVASLDQAMIDGVVEAAKGLNIGVGRLQIGRLGQEGQEALGNIYEIAAQQGGPGAQMFAQMFTASRVGSFTGVLEGGTEALAANTVEIGKNAQAWQDWLKEVTADPAQLKAVGDATAFLREIDASGLEAGAGTDLQNRIAMLRALPSNMWTPEQQAILDQQADAVTMRGKALGAEAQAAADAALATANEAASTLWDQVMEAIATGKGIAGLDQRAQIADQVRDTITAGLKGGLRFEEIKAQLGPSFMLLFDGLGSYTEDGAQRIGDAFADALGSKFRTLDDMGLIHWWENTTGQVLQGNVAEKARQLADLYIQSFNDDLLAAESADARNALMERINSMLPEDQRVNEWNDLVERSLPSLRQMWQDAGANGTQGDVAAMINRLFGQTETAAGPPGTSPVSRTIEEIDALINRGPALRDFAMNLTPTAPAGGTGNPVIDQLLGLVTPETTAALEAVGGEAGDVIVDGFAKHIGQGNLSEALAAEMAAVTVPVEDLEAKGAEIIGAIGAGMSAAGGTIFGALNSVLGGLLGLLPGSPVRRGVLKHPFLPNAGRAIIGQINSGIRGATLNLGGARSLPPMAPAYARAMPRGAFAASRPRPVGAPPTGRVAAGRGRSGGGGMPVVPTVRNQNIHVQTMNMLGAQEEDTIVKQFSFMSDGR
jgi:hypothetical protein